MPDYGENVPTATGRRLLEMQLDTQRAEVAALLDGLSEDESRTRLVPSLTTVLGLVKHATFVEQVWFHHRIGGLSRAELGLPDEVDASFVLAPEDTIASVRAAYAAACAHSREVTRGQDMAAEFDSRHGRFNLQFLHTHCIQELARHAGHGDILREQLIAARAADG